MDQTQREFLVEIEELVEQLFADLDELREARADSRYRRELIDRVFRRVHSVKGSAASCGLEAVTLIAHEFENLLAAIRNGQTHLNDGVLDACESATEALAESVSLAASGIVEPSRRALFDRLQAAAQDKTSEPSGITEALLKKMPLEIWQSLTEPEKHRLISSVEEGSRIFVVATGFNIGNFDEQFSQLKVKLTEHGEVISTSPTVDNEHHERINFRILYGSSASNEDLDTSVSQFSGVTFKEVGGAGSEALAEDYEQNALVPTFASVSSLANFVRTDLDKLDQLISSTHELFRGTSNALELALSQQQLTTSALVDLRSLDDHIRTSFMGLEHELIRLRMVSLGPTLQRAARAGRAAARQAGKEVDFEIIGADLLLDKLLADAIADSLIHLVRNAVDHGIERANTRHQAGKKARGTVRIEAVSDGSQSRVRVTDDGRGIDPLLVTEAAIRLGIAAGGAVLDAERSLRLIFRPGFTTLTSLSDVSGRGVGLDVVETAVEHVGGEIRVSSKPTQGTTFEIRLPVTFGLLAATVVVCGSNRYCLPSNQTVAIEVLDPDDAEKIMKSEKSEPEQAGTGHMLLVSLRDLLGQSREKPLAENSSLQQLQLVTCQFSAEQASTIRNGTKLIGVLVDRVEGSEEVLVRNLGRHAGRWYGVAGAAELRDGTVALVIDLPRLVASIEA